MSDNDLQPHERGIIITRIFETSRERVWDAWTNPERIKRWWGPKDFTAPVIHIDFRVGGKYLYCMKAAVDMGSIKEGQEFWSTGRYKEIIPMKKIVCTDSFADEHGKVVPASYYGMGEEFPLEMLVIVTFEDVDGPAGSPWLQEKSRTKVTLQHLGHPEGVMTEQTTAGWNQSFNKLAESLH